MKSQIEKIPNHLIHETSPYLLQHAYNPVQWYPWSNEAFALAKQSDLPVLVSIGYSTCHWCHVMERESFEDKDTADFMNAHFICIKVDREERPDLDQIYMDACQIMTGSGGWPLNCFLTPDGLPFFAGTYFPPTPAHQRPSWLQVLRNLSQAWHNQRDVVNAQAERLLEYIRNGEQNMLNKAREAADSQPFGVDTEGSSAFTTAETDIVFDNLRQRFDRQDGGFGYPPKFPSLMAICWLFEYAHFNRNEEALLHAVFSLERMVTGGIYDQLAGGLARYSTDSEWLVPHFEKMLYDNALFISALSAGIKMIRTAEQIQAWPLEHLAHSVQVFEQALEQTISFCLRQMFEPSSGAWYSAFDADSEGVEGKYYVWTKAEIDSILDPNDAAFFCAWYDVSEAGNWEHTNILRRVYTVSEFESKYPGGAEWVEKNLPKAQKKLLAIREQRIPPGLDDKSILAWNALMATALTEAYTATRRVEYLQQAVKTLWFIQTEFTQADSARLHHTWKDTVAKGEAVLDDYAYTIAAMLHVYEATGQTTWAEQAKDLLEVVFDSFDWQDGLLHFAPKIQTDVIVRKLDFYDNATPSSNAVMAECIGKLGHLFANRAWLEQSEKMLLAIKPLVQQHPLSFSYWAKLIQRDAHQTWEIDVAGKGSENFAASLMQTFIPNSVLAWHSAGSVLPVLADKAQSNRPLVYLCRNFTCGLPHQTTENAIQELFRAFPKAW